MSQSWDNVASMHDHLLTVYTCSQNIETYIVHANSILPVQDCPLVPCACADGSGMNFEPTPITAEATRPPLSDATASFHHHVHYLAS